MKAKKIKFSFLHFLIFSAFIHLTAFYLIQKNSLWFYSPIKENKITENHTTLQKEDKEKILKQFITNTFESYSDKKSKNTENYVKERKLNNDFFPIKENINKLEIKAPSQPILKTKLATKQNNITLKVDLSSKDKNSLLKDLKTKTNFTPTKLYVTTDKVFINKPEVEKDYSFMDVLQPINSEKVTKEFSLDKHLLGLSVKIPNKITFNSVKKTNLYKKITFPTLRDLKTYLYEDDFDIEVSHIPAKDKGYIFAITLIPKYNIDLPRIPQHYTLLIDKSNSIQKNRLKSSRDALYQAISLLKEEDSFNVIAFDNKMEKLFPEKRKLSDNSKKLARKFLMNLKLGSFFSSSNVYNSLYSSTYDHIDDKYIHSIVLLSNGEGLTNKGLHHRFMGQWTGFNAGQASLFAISMKQDKQLSDLEVISSLNRGWLVTSATKGGLTRKLMKLMKTIQNPIIKNVECSYISTTGNKFELFKPFRGLPHLYASEPYVIIGRCENLEDFTLVLQGKNNDKWLNIKKRIALKASKKSNPILLEQWALHKAWNCYADYLKEQKTIHLEKARKVLEPFNIPVAFQ